MISGLVLTHNLKVCVVTIGIASLNHLWTQEGYFFMNKSLHPPPGASGMFKKAQIFSLWRQVSVVPSTGAAAHLACGRLWQV